jgi:P27 family predicted phage terminase small subunit
MPRYRKPDTAKKLAGTFRRDRAKRRPKVSNLATVPQPPAHLTALARAEWHRIAPVICAQKTLAATDLRSLELLAEVLATGTLAQQTLARDGLTLRDGGKVRSHPCVKILEGVRAQAIRLLIEFGCTPRARGHVEPASDATPNNPFAELT